MGIARVVKGLRIAALMLIGLGLTAQYVWAAEGRITETATRDTRETTTQPSYPLL